MVSVQENDKIQSPPVESTDNELTLSPSEVKIMEKINCWRKVAITVAILDMIISIGKFIAYCILLGLDLKRTNVMLIFGIKKTSTSLTPPINGTAATKTPKALKESFNWAYVYVISFGVLIITVLEAWVAFELMLSARPGIMKLKNPKRSLRKALAWVKVSAFLLVTEITWSLCVQNLASFVVMGSLAIKSGLFVWILTPYIKELHSLNLAETEKSTRERKMSVEGAGDGHLKFESDETLTSTSQPIDSQTLFDVIDS